MSFLYSDVSCLHISIATEQWHALFQQPIKPLVDTLMTIGDVTRNIAIWSLLRTVLNNPDQNDI